MVRKGHKHPFTSCTHTVFILSTGWLVRLPVLEGQPVANDPHVPLPNDPHLPHVVGVLPALGRPSRQPVPASLCTVPMWAGPAHTHH